VSMNAPMEKFLSMEYAKNVKPTSVKPARTI
jgi:hypothetical protein